LRLPSTAFHRHHRELWQFPSTLYWLHEDDGTKQSGAYLSNLPRANHGWRHNVISDNWAKAGGINSPIGMRREHGAKINENCTTKFVIKFLLHFSANRTNRIQMCGYPFQWSSYLKHSNSSTHPINGSCFRWHPQLPSVLDLVCSGNWLLPRSLKKNIENLKI
jgi:hypothetical protein